ncbi:Golgi apyrase [Entophlyctis luteolus]|nr:Golgi apyrase [Entophlyctis luteolus]
MGGASTQFAFEPEPELQAQYATDLLNVSLKTVSGSTREFRVFVSSFLGFGVNEARRRYIQGLAEDFGFFPTGGEITLDRDEPEIHLHHHESLTLSRNEENLIHTVPDPCLPKNLIVESDKYLAETPLPHPLRIRGTGSLSKCLIDLRPYLRKQLPCAKEPCLFDGVFAPISDFSKHRFIGVSEYYYTPVAISGHFTQPADDGKSFHFRKFVENAEKLCSRTYNSLYSAHALKHGVIVEGSEEEARLQLQCFKSAWVLEILHEGIGILDGNDDPPQDATISLQYGDKEQVQRVTSFEPLNEVDGYKISWTLGAMIMHTAKQL